DYFPEIYYGRFSAQDAADLQPQIDKTLQYEQYTMPDPSYLNEVVMVAGMDSGHGYDWGNGQINYGTENYFNAAHGLTSHTYLYPESGSHSADIIQNVSDGVSYGNYTAHCSQSGWGDPSFTTGDIPGLQNQDEYCLLVGNCCLSSAYDANECFAEAIVRAENKGAVGYIGGSNSTYWDPDYYWGVGVGPITQDPPSYEETTLGAYDRTFHDHMEPFEDWYTTQDQMIFAGNLAVTQGDPGSAQYYWEIYCLMGDPSLMIYYSVPPVITVSYDPLMPLGATSFTVNTEPYAYVAISMNNVLYGAVLADAAGTAIVPLNPIQQPGTADVVVTKQNGQPYIGTVIVNNPAGPFVSLDEYTVKDQNGNGNGQADYGESIVLDVQLENLGMSDAENVSAVLSSDDTFVTITDDQQDYGTIAAQSTSMQYDAFAFDISDAIPDQHPLSFDLIMQDNAKETWNSSFTILVNAPDLVASAVIVDDVANGNGNGRLDPGEEADIIVTVGNEGHSDALDALASLSTPSSWITLVNNTVSFDTLFQGDEAFAVFTVTVDEDSPAGTSAAFSFDLTAGNYGCEKEFFLVIGQIPVLVIDFDGNHNSAPAMMTCFDNLEVGAELVTSMPADLNLYASVFVCLGVYSENHVLSENEGQALFDYLENGGRLYMEGGDTWYYDDITPVHPLFGIQGTEDGDGDLGTILGQDGTFTAEMTFAYSGDNNWIDHLAPISPAFVIFENVSPQYNCAIANDVEQNYKTIGSSFEFGGLDDGTTTKDELMIQYLEFFGIQGIWTSTGDEPALANDIQLYPNPASDQVYIGLNRSNRSELSVVLTNAFGQEVMTILEKQPVEGKIRFSADVSGLAAGVYYCIIRSDNAQEIKKLIITK
ncbi:MAG: T9SS type A sorting domain-containing protein, partial [Bacteroidetes bacterium]|nr:T9SS type A sorting domain-containing protein [Bacteroidota bacterium]